MSDGLLDNADALRAGYTDVLGDVAGLATSIDGDDWDHPTGCPGWSVRDVVAHVADLESLLIGRPRPDHTVDGVREHVRNPGGEFMEIGVDVRRGRPIGEVVDGLEDVVPRRLSALLAIRDADLDGEVPGFLGTTKLRNQLTIRIFDLWSHDQDIRRALRRPGDLDGPAAAHSRELMVRGAARRIQELLTPAAGTSVLVEIEGSGGARRGMTFDGQRGRGVVDAPPDPTATMRMDLHTFTVLACGRSDDPGARDRVRLSGDADLGVRMLADIAATP
ncbi:MAG: maleylpyruvate isomerase family mycothiol-dependent enzyme [Candidatus Dormibacteraeota bacterium]|nr:maleylpyruvate isomerase family mycothiol-dependent enzyme [Candidatus Dormibacteraeota bacterium]